MLHDLFDGDHYRRQTGLALGDDAALKHFLTTGEASGLDPCPYFSTRAYKALYPDWAGQGAATAIEDFLTRIERGEQRRPHPLIDPDYYRAAYPDLSGLGALAPLHFIRHGDREGRNPSAGFDAGFYRRCYQPLGQGHPFRHYITEGAALGLLPLPQPRDVLASQVAMRQASAGLARPFLLAAHDAQAAGVPILTLDLATALRKRGYDPVFLLGNAGPLAARFRALGPVFVLAEGWDGAGLAAGLPPETPAIVNTAAAASLAVSLAGAGLPVLVLIHEMADYVRDHGFLPDLCAARGAGAGLIVSMPRMAAALAEDPGGVDLLRPGIVLPPIPLAAFRAVREGLRGRGGPVFIGAGHADRRKGFDLFLTAAARIAKERADARFVWLGALDPWAQDLAVAARGQGLDLTLPGFVADSLAWYRGADVYLLTSRQDPGPMTAVHAAAVGTPFVGYAADIGLIGLSEGVGRFVPPGDEAGFVAAVLEAAAAVTSASRRVLRRKVRAETAFVPYVDALLTRLGKPSASAAS